MNTNPSQTVSVNEWVATLLPGQFGVIKKDPEGALAGSILSLKAKSKDTPLEVGSVRGMAGKR